MSVLLSPLVPASPSLRCPPVQSLRLHVHHLCTHVHLRHFSGFHMYALIHRICFSLSDLLHRV